MKLAQKTNEGCSSDWMRMSGSMLDPNTVYSCIKNSQTVNLKRKRKIFALSKSKWPFYRRNMLKFICFHFISFYNFHFVVLEIKFSTSYMPGNHITTELNAQIVNADYNEINWNTNNNKNIIFQSVMLSSITFNNTFIISIYIGKWSLIENYRY